MNGGFHLEDAITIVGLGGLVEGFDIFRLADLIDAQDPKFSEFHWQRLFQAGGVPTTMSQMLAEWKTSETSNIKALKTAEHFISTIRWGSDPCAPPLKRIGLS